jgi:N-acetylmuramoyl-L-alanine amidase
MKYGILLDPGHGDRKHTPGKRSPDHSVYEGEWSREIVQGITPILRDLGFETREIVTIKDDVSLRTRAYRANEIMKNFPDIHWVYVSVHINAAAGDNQWHDATGWSVYVSNGASEESRKLAQDFYAVAKSLKLQGNRWVPKNRYWEAGFTVLTDTKMPAILTENLYMDNKRESAFLASEQGKAVVVQLHVKAICDHFGVPYEMNLPKGWRSLL